MHDATIVATMLDYDVQRLLTFNVVDVQRFAPLITDEQMQVMQGGMAQAKGVDGEAPARIGRQKRRNRSRARLAAPSGRARRISR